MIPSEEMKIAVHPMDFEEFQSAIQGNTYQLRKEVYKSGKNAGGQIHRKWMKDFRLYMAVGGMPQAMSFIIIHGIKKKAPTIMKLIF